MELPIIADAKVTLQTLDKVLTDYPVFEFEDEIEKNQKLWRKEIDRIYHTQLANEYSQM